jgi:hypothetical protein
MNKYKVYEQYGKYLECGSCSFLQECLNSIEPICQTGQAFYKKMEVEELKKENSVLKEAVNIAINIANQKSAHLWTFAEIQEKAERKTVRRFNTKNREKIKIGNLNIYLPVEKEMLKDE